MIHKQPPGDTYMVRGTITKYCRQTGTIEELEEEIGTVDLPKYATREQMPSMILINGFEYLLKEEG